MHIAFTAPSLESENAVAQSVPALLAEAARRLGLPANKRHHDRPRNRNGFLKYRSSSWSRPLFASKPAMCFRNPTRCRSRFDDAVRGAD